MELRVYLVQILKGLILQKKKELFSKKIIVFDKFK